MPIRIQRRRVKGWKMPENTVSVTRPGKWGNPFKLVDGLIYFKVRDKWVPYSKHGGYNVADVIKLFKKYLLDSRGMSDKTKNHFKDIMDNISELRGKNLACFCPLDQPCHADVLLELSNK